MTLLTVILNIEYEWKIHFLWERKSYMSLHNVEKKTCNGTTFYKNLILT